jgi:hypothetical protein
MTVHKASAKADKVCLQQTGSVQGIQSQPAVSLCSTAAALVRTAVSRLSCNAVECSRNSPADVLCCAGSRCAPSCCCCCCATQVQVHLAARNPEQEKLEAEKRAEEVARLRCVSVSVCRRRGCKQGKALHALVSKQRVESKRKHCTVRCTRACLEAGPCIPCPAAACHCSHLPSTTAAPSHPCPLSHRHSCSFTHTLHTLKTGAARRA